MKSYPVYLFDLYGTLIDIHTDESPAAFWNDVTAFLGKGDSGEDVRAAYLRLCADEVERRAATLPKVPKDAIEPELKNVFFRLLHTENEQEAKSFARFFRKRSTEFLRPMPYARETLDALHARGARVYLLSNAQSCFTVDELIETDLLRRLDGVLLSSDAGMKKPYRGFFELLLRTFSIDPSSALMVGNDAAADIAGADAVGLNSAYYHTRTSGPRPSALPASCTEIPDLSELV